METACRPTLMSSADRQMLVKMEHVPSDLRYSGQKSINNLIKEKLSFFLHKLHFMFMYLVYLLNHYEDS